MSEVEIDFNVEKIKEAFKEKTEQALIALGGKGVTYVSRKIRSNKSIKTSNLINSITFATSKVAKAPEGKTDGKAISNAPELSLYLGTTVIYAPRVEFGFVGQDSLGRNFNQPAKSFLRAAIIENKDKIQKDFSRLLSAGGLS